ncbi:hypothetical protein OMAG_002829 [Candidatus Omnitrophus magneticus]|uniref:Uncharacterized protein n=1 Tax=Candidatus Omnitrophus magneticus TaxID=1609969 RepID=A0A0F0CPD4_9BACT|nr:hypothetical protein OMAG_002829 [Candidatus Omnitrophus magneticus]
MKLKVDEKNCLVIEDAPSYLMEGTSGLIDITLNGKWELTEDCDLKFTISEKERVLSGKTLILSGEIENVDANSLSFRFRESTALDGAETSTLTIAGVWQADKNNRITFQVSKNNADTDILTFQGAWKIGKKNELIYIYKKCYLKTKEDEDKKIIFNGIIELESGKIIYRVEKSDTSFFSFSARLKSNELSINSKTISYEVGITYTEKISFKSLLRTVEISGVWTIDKSLKISFNVVSINGEIRRIEFGIKRMFKNNGSISLSLIDRRGYDIGLNLELAKKFLDNNAELFMSLNKIGNNLSVMGGMLIMY